jgi:acetolactate synthase I/II/III large subunit
LPASHPLHIGLAGMHGDAWVNQAIQGADVLLALGARFDDRSVGNPRGYAPRARRIHVDIDPAEIGKVVSVEVGIVGDAGRALQALLRLVGRGDRAAWLTEIRSARSAARSRDILNLPDDGRLHAAGVMAELRKQTRGRAVIVTDVGQHQMWEAQYYRHERPRSLITSGGLGCMGFGLPAGIGAKIARPDEEVWVIAGDGGFQMTAAELSTVAQERLPLRIAVINNGYLGMVRQWQELFYGKRYAATPMPGPDFCKLADAHGIPARKVESAGEVRRAIAAARRTEGPVLLEFRVEPGDVVYPMVPAGANLDQMLRRPRPGPRGVAARGERGG